MTKQQIQPIHQCAHVQWGIYHRLREYAREMGDPRLATVQAETKDQAERLARRRGVFGPTGLWAHPLLDEELRSGRP